MIRSYPQPYFIFISCIVFLMYACNTRTTTEQRNRFERCREDFILTQELLIEATRKELEDSPFMKELFSDSTMQVLQDIKTMNLEEIAGKYNMSSSEINAFIRSICLSVEIRNSLKKFDAAMRASDKELNEILSDTFKLDVNKIKPVPDDTAGYLIIGEPKQNK